MEEKNVTWEDNNVAYQIIIDFDLIMFLIRHKNHQSRLLVPAKRISYVSILVKSMFVLEELCAFLLHHNLCLKRGDFWDTKINRSLAEVLSEKEDTESSSVLSYTLHLALQLYHTFLGLWSWSCFIVVLLLKGSVKETTADSWYGVLRASLDFCLFFAIPHGTKAEVL